MPHQGQEGGLTEQAWLGGRAELNSWRESRCPDRLLAQKPQIRQTASQLAVAFTPASALEVWWLQVSHRRQSRAQTGSVVAEPPFRARTRTERLAVTRLEAMAGMAVSGYLHGLSYRLAKFTKRRSAVWMSPLQGVRSGPQQRLVKRGLYHCAFLSAVHWQQWLPATSVLRDASILRPSGDHGGASTVPLVLGSLLVAWTCASHQ